MSINTIKNTMETYLRANLTDVAIKFNNTDYYEKNQVQLIQADIDALTLFVEPSIIPIEDNREVMSDPTPFKTRVFFQVSIYNKIGLGTGYVYTIVETLNTLFREQTINNVVCERVETLGSFTSGDFEVTPHRVVCHLWN